MRYLRFALIPAVLFLLPGFTLPTFSQPGWERTYGGTGNDIGRSVQQTSDGGYIVAGYTNSFGAGNNDVYLIKTDSLGDTLWTKTYGGPGDEIGYSVRQTTDGGYIIAGGTTSYGAGSADVYLVKTNANGDTNWTKTYGGTGNDVGYSVQQTTDGGYIVAGATFSFGAGIDDVYLIKTDSLGDTLWTRTYGGPNYDGAYSVRQTKDGGYILTGWTDSFGAGLEDVYLIKTDASGNALWTRTYGGTNYDEGESVQQTLDGGYIVAGGTLSFGPGYDNVYLIKTDSLGDTLWTRTYGGWNDNISYSGQQTTDGGYIIAGGTDSFGAGGVDVYLIKTNGSGDTLWTRTYGGTGEEQGYSVQQISDGGYIIAGYTNSFGAGGYNVYLIKTDSNGYLGVETPVRPLGGLKVTPLIVTPNPFVSYATVPGHEKESFALYDITGRRVGTYKGSQVGWDLRPGVYFVRALERKAGLGRIVKIK